MADFIVGVIVWLILCVCAFLLASLVGSFVALEWGFVGATPLGRGILAAVFIWLACVVYKVGASDD